MKKTRVLFLWFLLTGFIGCGENVSSVVFPDPEMPTQFFQNFVIPRFPTAWDQLNYARSEFSNTEEKKAALRYVSRRFPKSSEECGQADLILAYMNLGHNYRFAGPKDFKNAILAYKNVIDTYQDYPKIIVKAYWYLGWIYCDLVKEKKTGIQYYWHIVNTSPDIDMDIFSPVQWISVFDTSHLKALPAEKNASEKKWAMLSLLEIIRNSSDEIETTKAFNTLWNNYQLSTATGMAIKFLLQNQNHAEKIRPYVEPYLALKIANPYLTKEIRTLAGLE